MSAVHEEYLIFRNDDARVRNFSSSSLTQQPRRLLVFNTNIKTMQTYVKYIDDVYEKTQRDEEDKQKNTILDTLQFRNPSNPTGIHLLRSDLVRNTGRFFGAADNHTYLVVWLLSLKAGLQAVTKRNDLENVSFIQYTNGRVLEPLPRHAKLQFASNFQRLLEEGLTEGVPETNILLMSALLCGDSRLFGAYAVSLENREDISDFVAAVRQDGTGGPIARRVSNYQASAIKEEARYLYLYYRVGQAIRDMRFDALLEGNRFIDDREFLQRILIAIAGSNRAPNWLDPSREQDRTVGDFIRFFDDVDDEAVSEVCVSICYGYGLQYLDR